MRILLITDSYPPEVRSASHLMHELAKELAVSGNSITVLTTFPGYNLTEETKKRLSCYSRLVEEEGIRVIRVKTPPIHNVGHIIRGIAQLSLPFLFLWGSRLTGPQDVSVVYSPPLPLGLAAYFIGKAKRTPFVFNVQDLFPQNAIDLGALRQSALIKFFQWMENFVYRKAGHITVHSSGNLNYITGKGVPPEKVSVLPNWVDLDEFKVDGIPNPAGEKGEIIGKFVVFFGGIMGYAQDLETVVECANRLQDKPHILFLMLGDGAEKNALIEKSKSLNLKNIKFLPFVSKEDYPYWVNAIDVGLVALKKEMKTPVVPSKILGYMAAGKPILASLNPQSDGIQIVKEAQCGINVPPGDPVAMADAILRFANNSGPTKEMGINGRNYAKNHFSRDVCVNRYEEIFKEISNKREHISK